jgi:hypothetical protein
MTVAVLFTPETICSWPMIVTQSSASASSGASLLALDDASCVHGRSFDSARNPLHAAEVVDVVARIDDRANR